MPKLVKKTVSKSANVKTVSKKASKKKTVEKKKAKELTREIIYDKKKAFFYDEHGDKPEITLENAKELLGWEEVPEDEEGDPSIIEDADGNTVTVPVFRDFNDVLVRLSLSIGNRPYDPRLAKTWASEILNKRWKCNGESIIIGKTGIVISGQHRLSGLILACQEWRNNREDWPLWKKLPTMPCLIAFGVDEDDETVNTVDTGKPRSLTDILSRSSGYFDGDYSKSDKAALVRITDQALKLLFFRSGAGRDTFSDGRKRTHGDMIDFLQRHETLIEFVKHVFVENVEGKIQQLISLGPAAAMCYLMASSATDPEKYHSADGISERVVNWKFKKKALEFWTDLVDGVKELSGVKELTTEYTNNGWRFSKTDQGLIAKAWVKYLEGKSATKSNIALQFETDDDGGAALIEIPVVGGLDLGDPDDDSILTTSSNDDPSPDEIEERKSQIAEDHKASKQDFKVGEEVWVLTEDSEVFWKGKIEQFNVTKKEGKIAKLTVIEPKHMAGKTDVAKIVDLRRKQPAPI